MYRSLVQVNSIRANVCLNWICSCLFSRRLAFYGHFAAGLSIVCILWGGEAHSACAADLLDIYQLALRNDPTLEVSRYTQKAALEKFPQAVAGLLPTISLSGTDNVTKAHNQFSTALPVSRDVRAWNWSLQLTQPLFRMQNLYAYDEAEEIVAQAQAQYILSKQDMILRVSQAYFGVLSGQEEINVVDAEFAAALEQLNIAKRGYEKGVAAITDIRENEARVNLARSHMMAARNDLDAKIAELGKIVDEVPEQLSPISPFSLIPPPQPSKQSFWVNKARENNQSVRAARFGLQVAEATARKTRAEYSPTLDLVASYGGNYSSGSATMPTDFASKGQTGQIGVQFNMSLFAGGATSSHVSEAMANKYRAGAELEVARRQAATDARLAYSGVRNGLAQITALESAVESGKAMLEESRMGYKLGMYNNFKLLDAKQQFYMAQRDLIKARYETVLQALKLKAAAGILSEADLLSANALLVN